ncbi:class F sortase [Amycolatopsis sp. NPDC059021]|uniref:class F sortase n=1 Tax=Amycolatopsis sp. NPDC059021 TaxID=3346704 RepID=UPI00366DC249
MTFPSSSAGAATPKRTSRRWIFVAAAALVVAAVVAALFIFTGTGDPVVANGTPGAPHSAPAAPAGHESTDSGKAPGKLTLPGGGAAKTVRQDLAADGTLPIPQALDEAAWWGANLGADRGVTVLSGHVNWKGAKGPFFELWQVKAGQEVTLADTSGGRWTYRIDAAETIHKTQLAARSEQLFAPEGPHKLVLVTCGGEYVGGSTGYEDNRVVTASLMSRP